MDARVPISQGLTGRSTAETKPLASGGEAGPSSPPLTGDPSHLQLLQGSGELFPALIHDMDEARRVIRLESYIFDLSGAGAEVAEALERAAQRGVQVCVLVDGFGTAALSPDWVQLLERAGVQWRVFAPLGRWWFLRPVMWRRLHRKLVSVDSTIAYCGGINILDDFHDPNHGALQEPRFDFAVRASGALARQIEAVMVKLWDRVAIKQALTHGVKNKLSRVGGAVSQAMQHMRERHWPDPHTAPAALALQAELVLRDNVKHRTNIERAYLRAIRNARREVIIANAYFVPGRSLQRALLAAAKRGVQVKLLLQGKYEYFMQYYASRPVYAGLLAQGVEIHEYAASFLHAKVAVIDGEWATVGSSNLDPLSLLMAREANVVVHDDAPFGQALRAKLLHAMAHGGRRMDADTFSARPIAQRAKERVALMGMRLALLLLGRRYL